jgi:hypothetical protein
MPKKRAAVPVAPTRPAARAPYAADASIPQRGLDAAVAWPDTGVLLSLHARGPVDGPGSEYDLPGIFRDRFHRRLRLGERIDKELRGLASSDDRGADVRNAASAALQRLRFGDRPVTTQSLDMADVADVELVKSQLRAVPGASQDHRAHQGEAELIVLARKAAARGTAQLLLANDAGASLVARAHGIPSRHAADVIAELACAEPSLTPQGCFRRFRAGDRVSAVPHGCAPSGPDSFTCSRPTGGACPACE